VGIKSEDLPFAISNVRLRDYGLRFYLYIIIMMNCRVSAVLYRGCPMLVRPCLVRLSDGTKKQ